MFNWFNRLINQRQNTRVSNLDTNVNLDLNLDPNLYPNLGLDNFISDVSLTIFYTPTIFYYDLSDVSQFDNLVFVLINNNYNNKDAYKKIATMREIKLIKKITYNSINSIKYNIPDECPITLDKFENDEEVFQLRCGHCFNGNAIVKWLRTSSNQCPVCRYSFNWRLI